MRKVFTFLSKARPFRYAVQENHPVQTALALVRTPLLSLRAGGEMTPPELAEFSE
jgi:hypothetical protein